jgi:hypothetical protein
LFLYRGQGPLRNRLTSGAECATRVRSFRCNPCTAVLCSTESSPRGTDGARGPGQTTGHPPRSQNHRDPTLRGSRWEPRERQGARTTPPQGDGADGRQNRRGGHARTAHRARHTSDRDHIRCGPGSLPQGSRKGASEPTRCRWNRPRERPSTGDLPSWSASGQASAKPREAGTDPTGVFGRSAEIGEGE